MAGKELLEQGERRREAIIGFVRSYYADNGYPPSMAEIAQGVGIAKNAVRHHLLRLQADGKVTVDPGRYRSLKLVKHD